jgi:hypothetical protein
MEDINIIKSDIIGETINDFWKNDYDFSRYDSHKPVLVISLVYEKGSVEENAILKIVQACKLSDDSYQIMQLHSEDKLLWATIKERINAQAVILLGVHPQQLGISALFSLNDINHYASCVFIPALWVTQMEQEPELKRQLWTQALKPYFIDQQK